MSKLKSIQLSSFAKVAAVAAILVLAAVSWFTVRWTLGVTVSAKADSKEIAEIAVGLAPGHPYSHLVSGIMLDRTFLPEDLVRSQSEFEKAVALSPNDFRLWLELARSYEKNGDLVRAEAAYRRSLELAPNYSRVQWGVGNFLLRVDKADEAFSLIRSAADKEFALAASAAAVAWNIYGGDLARVETYFGGSDNLQAGLASHLAGSGRFEDAIRIWESVPAEKREGELRPTAETILTKLVEAKRFLLVLKMDELAGKTRRLPGSVSNPGFEEDIRLTGGDRFAWQFSEGTDAQIGIDMQQVREGVRQRALAIIFNSDGKSFRGVSQLVPVGPGGRYSLSFNYRSEIENRATMRWEVLDASDSKVLASSEPIAERSDWAVLRTEFTVPEGSEGVVIRLVRTGCLSTTCPLTGKVWFDDVVVSRL